jgi:hypothetical protein
MSPQLRKCCKDPDREAVLEPSPDGGVSGWVLVCLNCDDSVTGKTLHEAYLNWNKKKGKK